MATRLSIGRVRKTYEFIKVNRRQYGAQVLFRVLEVAPSGYYDWLSQPISNRANAPETLQAIDRIGGQGGTRTHDLGIMSAVID